MNLNLKSLIEKLDGTCRDTLEAAAGLCLSRANYEVDLEHFFLKLIERRDSDFARILAHCESDPTRLSKDLLKALDKLKTGNTRTPVLSHRLVELIQEALLLGSVDYGSSKVRSGHIVLALMSNNELAPLAREISKEFNALTLSLDSIRNNLAKITSDSSEAQDAGAANKQSAKEIFDPTLGASGPTPSLDQYTIDLTAQARAGRIDPILGREAEIRQVIDILIRRRQNNPILTGEAGVGKTAVVEGFAQRVAEGDVPTPLKGVAVRTLDLGLLQAGAGVKGEFEQRLKSVIDEVKAAVPPIILFIDEAHTMIGAGGQAGQSDAANLLKPALARGELRTIAATTWAEYKKYFEKDAALARRFQVVKVDEPSESQALGMLRGLTRKLEDHHQVRILDKATEAAVKLSHRYIAGRQLPDKAISVLDTACARVAIGLGATPATLEDAQRDLDQLKTEIASLEREAITSDDHLERIEKLKATQIVKEQREAELRNRWETEKNHIARIHELRDKMETQVAVDGNSNNAADLRTELSKLTNELHEMQGDTPLMHPSVTAQTVAEVIAGWTGIPVGRMLADEVNTLLALEQKLAQRVVGQSHALEAISERIRTSRANLTDPRRPIGVFLLVGPSGVGKTETALSLAETLYGGERNLITINLSEYQEAHSVSGLKGSPPGYVGYGQGGVLTEAVRRKPYSVVLLDEAEKAHSDVMELFYQVFDKGSLEDSEGREVDFKNTVILLTSNTGSDTIHKLCANAAKQPSSEDLLEAIRPQLLQVFKAALLGRMVVTPYYPIADDTMREIAKLQLSHIADRLSENHRAAFTYDDEVITAIVDRCREVESGARNIDHILTRTLLPKISTEFLSRMSPGQNITSVHVGVGEAGDFRYEIN